MNLLFSLFGGMILTAVLYGLGRVAGLSNFWAAVAASAVPTVVYLLYASLAWPGLDVITMHVVAFPTVAVLLFQLYGAKANHAKTLHWAPKLMIGFFLTISLLYGALIYVSSQGLPPALAHYLLPNTQGKNIHTGFAGVVAHKQEDAAKGIGQHLSNVHKLKQLGWTVEVDGLADLIPGRLGAVAVYIRNANGAAEAGLRVDMALARPGAEPGPAIELGGDRGEGYRGHLMVDRTGTWVAHTTLRGAGEVVRLERAFEVR